MQRLYDYHNNPLQLVQVINQRKLSVPLPSYSINEDLIDTYQFCRVLDEYLKDYFQNEQKKSRMIDIESEIDKILLHFKSEVMHALSQKRADSITELEKIKSHFKNIFEFAKAENLSFFNVCTNIIQENLGHKFEDIADLSTQVFIPDKLLGIKIKGVDLIIYDTVNNKIRYTQLKTKRDTLTGSKANNTINELKIHPHPIFAAALDMGKTKSSWPISKKAALENNIELLSGEAFWSLINLDYHLILNKISEVIYQIDKELYNQVDRSQLTMIKLYLLSIISKS